MEWKKVAACVLAGGIAMGWAAVSEARHGDNTVSTTIVSTQRRAQEASSSTPLPVREHAASARGTAVAAAEKAEKPAETAGNLEAETAAEAEKAAEPVKDVKPEAGAAAEKAALPEKKAEPEKKTEPPKAVTAELPVLPKAETKAETKTLGRTPAAAEPLPTVSEMQPMHLWPVEAVDVGGTLLFSDSPETVASPGILYADTVKGDARVLFYHVNASSETCNVAVMLENRSDQYAIVHITRGGMSQPSNDYLEVGRDTQIEYFDTKLNEVLYIGAGETRLLQAKMETTPLQPGQLIYGVYDFSSSVPVKVSVVMYPAADNPYEFIQTAPVLPKDAQRLRGTFTGMDRIIRSTRPYNPDLDGIVYIPIGDDHIDAYRRGIDATDGSSVVNYGNYGVLYRIEIPTVGRHGSQYFLSPLGGKYAGAMRVELGNAGNSKLLLTPSRQSFFGDNSTILGTPAGQNGMAFLTPGTELADLGTYGRDAALSFEYSPPGASNLPVRFILAPTDQGTLAQKPKKR